MKSRMFMSVFLLGGALFFAKSAHADYVISCESHDHRFNRCELRGDVRDVFVQNRESDAPCIEGRTWGWNRRAIWVDDGCRANFYVDTRDRRLQDQSY